MADEELFEDLHDVGVQAQLRNLLFLSKFKSIENVKVFRRKIKKIKWKIFPYKERIRIIEVTVNESQFIMESLIDDLSLEDIIAPYSDDHILEIVDKHGNEVV
ncbi:MAG: hypothetical protein K0R18_257 [Bacillales bacterium]|jgi:hypothetical protein|nr:hypothetical protein [Bacillales bacterium]